MNRILALFVAGSVTCSIALYSSPQVLAVDDLTSGLSAYWTMDETSGTRVDSVGSLDLTDSGSTGTVAGLHGNAATFTSVAETTLSTTGDTTPIQIRGDFSVSFWYKPLTAALGIMMLKAPADYSSEEWSFAGQNGGDHYVNLWLETVGDAGWVDYSYQRKNGIDTTGNPWIYIVGTYTASDKIVRLYINNIEARDSDANRTMSVGPWQTDSPLWFGNEGDLAGGETNGSLDEVGIWQKVLTADERTALYNGGAGMSYADILATGATPTPAASGGRTQTGTLVIQKVLVGGDPAIDPDDFTFTLDTETARFSEAGSDTYVRPVGTHIVKEDASPGYTTTYSGDCDASGSITVVQDVTRTCIITNTAIPTPTPAPGSTPAPSQTPLPGLPGGPTLQGLSAGDLIRADGDLDIYMVNAFGFKRLFLNPTIFGLSNSNEGFPSVKPVTATVRAVFPTSNLFRDCSVNDQDVYALEVTGEDTGVLHHVQIDGEDATEQDPAFFLKVFCINTNEFNWYTKGTPYTSLSEIPVYKR